MLKNRMYGSLTRLVDEGRQLAGSIQKRYDGLVGEYESIDTTRLTSWRSQAKHVLGKLGDNNSSFLEAFLEAENNSYNYSSSLGKQVGALSGAVVAWDEQLYFDAKELVQADLLSDFLDQAQSLLDSKYHVAAAVIGGAVLEDALRGLAERNDVELPSRGGINNISAKLLKSGVLNKLNHKRVTALADIRNNAAHGQVDQFSWEDVNRMLDEVGHLLAGWSQ